MHQRRHNHGCSDGLDMPFDDRVSQVRETLSKFTVYKNELLKYYSKCISLASFEPATTSILKPKDPNGAL